MIDKTHVLQLVLSHFTVVRVVNGVYYCICPGHSDNKPSLHISMGDIKIILDCKAKCNYKKILDKIGMKPEELYYDYYDKNRKQGNRMSPKQYGYEKNCIDKYPYFRMDNGQQTHIQYKMPGKRYPQGYNNNGEWVSTLKDIDTHLSIFCNVSIEKLKQEAKQGKHLIYAEGAKDVKTCGKYGLIGFTCGSSGDWKKKKEVFKYIKNAVLIIFADNDEPGINSANGIKLYYEQLGGRATVIIPPGVSQKGDISDYMETHTKEELYELVENALNSTVTEKNLLPEVSQVEVERLLSYKVDYDKDGNVKSKKILQTVRNFEIIMENDTRFVGKIKFDEFSQQTFLMGSVPWESKKNYRAWGSYDDSALFSILQSDYGMNSRNDYFDALKNVAMKNKFHPVRDILDSLVWDGEDHIRNLLPDYLGVEDTEYQYQVMKLWMMGAVSRIYKPGCKFDYTVIFKGRQGLGKSTFLQLLALNDNWFNDSLDSLDSDKAAQSLMGSWIIELAELYSKSIASLDSPVNDDSDQTLIDSIQDDCNLENNIINEMYDQYSKNELWSIVEDYTTERENHIIREYFLYNKSMPEIAKNENVTVSRIREIREKGLRKLKFGKAKRELIEKFDIVDSGIYKNGYGNFTQHNNTSKVEYIAIRRVELQEEYEKKLQEYLNYMPRKRVCL